MPSMRTIRVVLVLSVAIGAVLFTTLSGRADPNLDVDPIPPHRHFIETASGKLIEVGPRLCDDPAQQHAFNQFHSNVHHALSPVSPPGTEPGPGPEDGAQGLHNGYGAELTFTGC